MKALVANFNMERSQVGTFHDFENFTKFRFQLYCVTIQQTPDNARVADFKDEQIEHFICLPALLNVDLDIPRYNAAMLLGLH